jgi:ABC-2 type transport system permease protein
VSTATHNTPGTSAVQWAVSDTLTMIQRSLRQSARQLDSLLITVALPVLLMLMFVYIFGGAINTGGDYVNYVVPGIILLCTGYGASTTAVDVPPT